MSCQHLRSINSPDRCQKRETLRCHLRWIEVAELEVSWRTRCPREAHPYRLESGLLECIPGSLEDFDPTSPNVDLDFFNACSWMPRRIDWRFTSSSPTIGITWGGDLCGSSSGRDNLRYCSDEMFYSKDSYSVSVGSNFAEFPFDRFPKTHDVEGNLFVAVVAGTERMVGFIANLQVNSTRYAYLQIRSLLTSWTASKSSTTTPALALFSFGLSMMMEHRCCHTSNWLICFRFRTGGGDLLVCSPWSLLSIHLTETLHQTISSVVGTPLPMKIDAELPLLRTRGSLEEIALSMCASYCQELMVWRMEHQWMSPRESSFAVTHRRAAHSLES